MEWTSDSPQHEFCSSEGQKDVDCANQNQSLSTFSVGPVPCYVGIVSDTLSCVASVLIIAMYIAWKDYREKGVQSIITFIAIADFFTAIAYLFGSVNLLMYTYNDNVDKQDLQRCNAFVTVCKIESYIATCATMSSYFWTVILGFHFFLTIVLKQTNLAIRLIPVYHVLAWGVPVSTAFPLLVVEKLAYAPFVSGVWCYMEIYRYAHPYQEKNALVPTLIQVPELTAFLIILLLYIITRVYFSKRTQQHIVVSHEEKRHTLQNKVDAANKILLFIPVAFVFLRVWCIIQYFYVIYLGNVAENDGHCIPRSAKVGHVILGVLQAIGDGGQGWANVIIYVFLSPITRKRLIHSLPKPCQHVCKNMLCCKCTKYKRPAWTTVTKSKGVAYESTISTDSIAIRMEQNF